MALFLVILTLSLAVAASGCIHAGRQEKRLTITIDGGPIWGWIQGLWELGKECIASIRVRRRPTDSDSSTTRRQEVIGMRWCDRTRIRLDESLEDELIRENLNYSKPSIRSDRF